jgi:hypothetical protein
MLLLLYVINYIDDAKDKERNGNMTECKMGHKEGIKGYMKGV